MLVLWNKEADKTGRVENAEGEGGRVFSLSQAENEKEKARMWGAWRGPKGLVMFSAQLGGGLAGHLLHLPNSGNHITVGHPNCFSPP